MNEVVFGVGRLWPFVILYGIRAHSIDRLLLTQVCC
jgi:hypothetical protein